MDTTLDTPVRTWQTGHVGLNVTDLARSVRFYREVFGFQVLHEVLGTGPNLRVSRR